ncbi:MAG TPA: TIM barrel protein [Vicinamibacterales bacterium]|nr:TIM barrel protein [Vicinamibacterales bacterium]
MTTAFRLRAEATGFERQAERKIRLGCAAITWGGNDDQAIAEVGQVGYAGIQLRATAFDKWGTRPAELKQLLATHGLGFPVLSSGNLKYQPADRQAQLDLHVAHAKFVRDAGGEMLQVIDEKPKDRPVTADDYKALADMLNTLGERTRTIGVPLVYHHHMNSTGEPPEAIEAIMADSAASAVGLLFDIAHYQQGGGDPVKAIRRYGKAIKVVHLKDVRPIDAAPGYQWVELGRGTVDVKGCVSALKDAGFDGWAIVELDRVVDAGGTAKASAAANREYARALFALR